VLEEAVRQLQQLRLVNSVTLPCRATSSSVEGSGTPREEKEERKKEDDWCSGDEWIRMTPVAAATETSAAAETTHQQQPKQPTAAVTAIQSRARIKILVPQYVDKEWIRSLLRPFGRLFSFSFEQSHFGNYIAHAQLKA
ncbi:hypothetical protein PMAYCL1PPCAC_13785, partial [Pristionchus mayeri]